MSVEQKHSLEYEYKKNIYCYAKRLNRNSMKQKKIKDAFSHKRNHENSNPYDNGSVLKNFLNVLCSSLPPSVINLRETIPNKLVFETPTGSLDRARDRTAAANNHNHYYRQYHNNTNTTTSTTNNNNNHSSNHVNGSSHQSQATTISQMQTLGGNTYRQNSIPLDISEKV